ncbi:hypothetical protein ES708_22480 [subsurface metagenome]
MKLMKQKKDKKDRESLKGAFFVSEDPGELGKAKKEFYPYLTKYRFCIISKVLENKNSVKLDIA